MATKKPDPKSEKGDDGQEEEAPKVEPLKAGFAGIGQIIERATTTAEIQAGVILLCNELDRIINK